MSKCGASFFLIDSNEKTTASALKGLPSWNVTPFRSLNTHLRGRVLADVPRLGEPGHERGQPVAPGQVPRDQGLVDLVADEAEAFESRCPVWPPV